MTLTHSQEPHTGGHVLILVPSLEKLTLNAVPAKRVGPDGFVYSFATGGMTCGNQ